MLILEIAAGIILAVIFLACLPLIIRWIPVFAGLVILGAALLVAAFFILMYWPDSLYTAAGIAAFVAFCVWTHKDKRWHRRAN